MFTVSDPSRCDMNHILSDGASLSSLAKLEDGVGMSSERGSSREHLFAGDNLDAHSDSLAHRTRNGQERTAQQITAPYRANRHSY